MLHDFSFRCHAEFLRLHEGLQSDAGGLDHEDGTVAASQGTYACTVEATDAEGRVALIFDDMISTAGSICGAAQVMHEAGARAVYLAATHGLLCGQAIEKISAAPINELVLTDTIPLPPEKAIPKITVLGVAPLLGEAIKRIHRNESVSKLFD